MQRRLREAADTLWMQMGRPPTDPELAAELSLDPDGLHRLRAAAVDRVTVHLEETLYEEDGDVLTVAESVADPGKRPDEHAQEAAEVEALWEWLDRQPPRVRRVFALYYVEGKTLRQIAAEMGRSESRVHQIHDQGRRAT